MRFLCTSSRASLLTSAAIVNLLFLNEIYIAFHLATVQQGQEISDAPLTHDGNEKIERILGNGQNNVSRAPWDPIGPASGRGHRDMKEHCGPELNITGCMNSLPLNLCLSNRWKIQNITLSKGCSRVLNPCQMNQNSKECVESRIYGNTLNDAETEEIENILALVDQASSMGLNGHPFGILDGSRKHDWGSCSSC